MKKLLIIAMVATAGTLLAKDYTQPTGTVSNPLASKVYSTAARGLEDLKKALQNLQSIPLTNATPEVVEGVNKSIKDLEQQINLKQAGQ